MSLRCFAGRSLAALCMTFMVECGVWAQDAASVYTPSYFPSTPRVPLGAVTPPPASTPLFRAILPVQALQPPAPSAVNPPAATPVAPAAPGTFDTGVVVQSTPAGPIARTVEPLDQAVEYVMGTFQTEWDDSAIQTSRWFNADYQMSWLRGQHGPSLVTTSGSAVPLASAGVLGLNTTTVALGGTSGWDTNPSSGIRLNAGRWLDSCWGVEVGGFFLENKANIANFASDGSANSFSLARPFVDAATGTPQAAIVALAGNESGSISATTRTQMWGAETNLVFREEPGRFFQTQVRAGFRYISLDDEILIQQTSTPLGAVTIPFNGNLAVTNPDSVRVTDSFKTHNDFFGPQFGFDTSWRLGRLVIDLDAKVALGDTHQEVTINGTSETISGGRTTNLVQGGLLANSANIGHYNRDAFSVVPEIELKLEYRWSPMVTTFISYDALIWGDVATSADQVPSTVDVTRVPTNRFFGAPGGVNPGFTMGHGDFVSQSAHVGLILKF